LEILKKAKDMKMTEAQLKELKAAYQEGREAARCGLSADNQPYGEAMPGFLTQKITAWFLGYMDGRDDVGRCGTTTPLTDFTPTPPG
jgi:hypothetical protein